MVRLFVPPQKLTSQKIIIENDDFHYLCNVLRKKIGDQIEISDGKGKDFLGEILSIDRKKKIVKIKTTPLLNRGLPSLRITIAQSIPKGVKMDFVVQKCAELGIKSIIPLYSKRTVVKLKEEIMDKKIKRWQKIARHAGEQSKQSFISTISPPVDFSQLLGAFNQYDLILIPYEKEKKGKIKDVLTKAKMEKKREDILIIIGPEGGFEEEEINLAEKNGAIPVSLGRFILRAETAAIITTALVKYEMEEDIVI